MTKIKAVDVLADLKAASQKKSQLKQLATTPNAKAFLQYMIQDKIPLDRQLQFMQKYMAQAPQDQLTAQELAEMKELSKLYGHSPPESYTVTRYDELAKKWPR